MRHPMWMVDGETGRLGGCAAFRMLWQAFKSWANPEIMGCTAVAWHILRRLASSSFLLLVAMPFVPSSFLLLIVWPGATSSVLAPSCVKHIEVCALVRPEAICVANAGDSRAVGQQRELVFRICNIQLHIYIYTCVYIYDTYIYMYLYNVRNIYIYIYICVCVWMSSLVSSFLAIQGFFKETKRRLFATAWMRKEMERANNLKNLVFKSLSTASHGSFAPKVF